MHHLDNRLNVLDRGLRQNAVAQVENMPWSAVGKLEDGIDPLFDLVSWREQYERVEVALHCTVMADKIPAAIERNTPVDSDNARVRFGNEIKHPGGVCSKQNCRHAFSVYLVENPLRGGQNIAALVVGSQ